jgi:hypothetical protein
LSAAAFAKASAACWNWPVEALAETGKTREARLQAHVFPDFASLNPGYFSGQNKAYNPSANPDNSIP